MWVKGECFGKAMAKLVLKKLYGNIAQLHCWVLVAFTIRLVLQNQHNVLMLCLHVLMLCLHVWHFWRFVNLNSDAIRYTTKLRSQWEWLVPVTDDHCSLMLLDDAVDALLRAPSQESHLLPQLPICRVRPISPGILEWKHQVDLLIPFLWRLYNLKHWVQNLQQCAMRPTIIDIQYVVRVTCHLLQCCKGNINVLHSQVSGQVGCIGDQDDDCHITEADEHPSSCLGSGLVVVT